MQPSTRVILVRHGRSTFNDQGRYQGSSNEAVLTQLGKETSRLVGQHLKQLAPHQPINIVYASPLHRVQQTAHEIARAMAPVSRPPIVVSHDLKEISLGCWEGLTYAQVKQQFANQYQCWQQRPHEFALPVNSQVISSEVALSGNVAVATETYFPVRDLYQKARQFWRKVLPRHAGSTLLVVSHSGTIHALISTALGISPEYHHSLQQSNCGISEITFSGSFSDPLREPTVQLHQLNQTVPLGETLPKLKVNKQGMRLLLVNDGIAAGGGDRLLERLKSAPIDFCLSTDKEQAWLRSLSQYAPKMLCLGAQKANFLQDWQQHLEQSYQPPSSRATAGLMTGLVIAPRDSIQQLIAQTLGGRLEDSDRIALRQGYFSVVHYPFNHRPVVQAVNT